MFPGATLRRTRPLLALAALVLLVAAGPARAAGTSVALYLPVIGRVEAFRAEPMGGFDFATAVAPLPDGRLLVGERTGRVWRVAPGGGKEAFLDLTRRVVSDHLEQGLLEIAVDPRFADNGYFYVMYTGKFDGPNSILVSRFHVLPDTGLVEPLSELVLLSVAQTSQIHHGGGLAFAADGLLYVGIGDGTNGEAAQQPNTVRGKIVRLVVGQAPPAGEPPLMRWLDARRRVDAELFAQGLRNPWRITFDPATGDLFIADVGFRRWEEVNLAPAGSRGLNFGWPCREGPDTYNDDGPCAGDDFVGPIHTYDHQGGRCAIIGGGVVRLDGPLITRRYVFGDYCSGEIMALEEAGGAWRAGVLGDLPDGNALTTLGRDALGHFYAATATEGGPLFRLTLPPPGLP